MYKLISGDFGLSKATPGSTTTTQFAALVDSLPAAIEKFCPDEVVGYWVGENGVAFRGTAVALSPTTTGATDGFNFAEAYDHDVASPQWRRRVVGILLTPEPAFGGTVRIKLLGRAYAPKAGWSSQGYPGAPVFLKSGTAADKRSYGLLTLDTSETNPS